MEVQVDKFKVVIRARRFRGEDERLVVRPKDGRYRIAKWLFEGLEQLFVKISSRMYLQQDNRVKHRYNGTFHWAMERMKSRKETKDKN